MMPRPTGDMLPTIYYKFILIKKKDPFLLFVKFAGKLFCSDKGYAQRAQQSKEDICPKIPKGAQRGGKAQKKHDYAENGGKKHIQPQLAAAEPQGKEIASKAKEKGVERIKKVGKGAPSFAPPNRTQKIIQQGEAYAQQERLRQRAGLRCD